jgi:hypothetical protein
LSQNHYDFGLLAEIEEEMYLILLREPLKLGIREKKYLMSFRAIIATRVLIEKPSEIIR